MEEQSWGLLRCQDGVSLTPVGSAVVRNAVVRASTRLALWPGIATMEKGLPPPCRHGEHFKCWWLNIDVEWKE